ncbi:hypothetical protein D7B24_001221 [Verticillium nonalfalfae]|uniref:Zn(2)-C6 fungal-type domain-containing protein n=1 Tax=Verticillium nonalfalfae TaxID=1051616 RepID=A0A3M9Y076_9PEZI|nr:uncharacterized protein D7B24_001221 [Verticillium nonalfalfae]RNJ53919.1 hypothetical protein D7B24_001221 [Verticillium nonalfalfae]
MDSQASTPTAAAAARVSKSAQHSAESASGSSPQRMSRKRSLSTANGDTLGSPGSDDTITHNHRRGSKGHKVSRACDHCKQRKAKCSGTIPCATCSNRGLTCLYAARYSRGRPPTPPPSRDHHPAAAPTHHVNARLDHQTEPRVTVSQPENMRLSVNRLSESVPASRASPELGMAEIEGQVFDPTSGVTFLHRAWKRLAKHDGAVPVNDSHAYASVQHQPVMLAGDRPLPQTSEEDIYRLNLPGHQDLVDLLAMYFDVCIATYHIVHRPTAQSWLETIETNVQGGQVPWQGLGRARTSIVLACLAVATAHRQKSRGLASDQVDALSLSPSDHLFCVAAQLTDAETGSPRLESAQARIIQTLYLLTTSRFNRAWYTFGNGLQIISALGLHRKSARKRQLTSSPVDYIQSQFRVRTFWTAYILDKYLGVIFGRPRHYHDDDIDQVLPDKIDDDDMTAQGPIAVGGEQAGAAAEALIFHIKIAQIISKISREVYSIKPISEEERISAAHRLSKEVHEWKESLPPYLGSIHPSMLVPSFRRKSIVLKLGYSHAIMHANRLFLLATVYPESETQIAECLGAARSVFETVDGLAAEGPIFHAFWWTQYVTFCALVISYVWDIQLKRRGVVLVGKEQAKHTRLIELARRCQTHLAKATATNSPSRRYAVILEEFRSEAMGNPPVPGGDSGQLAEVQPGQAMHSEAQVGPLQDVSYYQLPGPEGLDVPLDPSGQLGHSLLDEWHTTDWLDLDSSAFGPYMDLEPSSLHWMSDIGI